MFFSVSQELQTFQTVRAFAPKFFLPSIEPCRPINCWRPVILLVFVEVVHNPVHFLLVALVANGPIRWACLFWYRAASTWSGRTLRRRASRRRAGARPARTPRLPPSFVALPPPEPGRGAATVVPEVCVVAGCRYSGYRIPTVKTLRRAPSRPRPRWRGRRPCRGFFT